jgi:hypothetical protein
MENSIKVFKTLKIELPYEPPVLVLSMAPKNIKSAYQIVFHEKVNKLNAMYIHNGGVFSHKENEILTFAAK